MEAMRDASFRASRYLVRINHGMGSTEWVIASPMVKGCGITIIFVVCMAVWSFVYDDGR